MRTKFQISDELEPKGLLKPPLQVRDYLNISNQMDLQLYVGNLHVERDRNTNMHTEERKIGKT